MKVDYVESLKKAFEFALNLKHIGHYLTINFAILAPIFGLLGLFIYMIGGLRNPTAAGFMGTLSVLSFFIIFLALIIVLVLLFTWASMAVVKAYHSKKTIWEGLKLAKPYFWRFVAVSIILGIIDFVVRLIPIAGFFITIFLALVFLFVVQLVLIGEKKFGEVFGASWDLFKENLGDVLLTALLNFLIALLILIISALPLIILIVSFYLRRFEGIGTASFLSGANIAILIFGLGLLIVGVTVATLFSAGFLTEAYLGITRKAPKAPRKI